MVELEQTDLQGQRLEVERQPTKAGWVTIFDNAVVYDVNPLVALRYAERRKRHKAFGHRFGAYKGIIIGEVPVIPGNVQILFEFYRPDERVEARRASKRHLRRRGIPLWHYNRFLRKNPLSRYLDGKAPLRPIICSECGQPIARRRPGYRLKPVPLCQECNVQVNGAPSSIEET